jgi:signal transduction histidine kinase
MGNEQREPADPRASEADLEVIAGVLQQEVLHPLAALRASLETLAGRPEHGPDAAVLDAALRQVVGLGRAIGDLADFAEPPPLRPTRCSIEEIVLGALDDVGSELRGRVLLALEDRRARLLVDGPLLSRCLARLITESLCTGAEVMLRARCKSGSAEFTVVHDRPSRAPAGRSLRLAIAERDVRRMGGSLSLQSTRERSTTIVAGLAADLRREAAA